jgi:hypothetical protein
MLFSGKGYGDLLVFETAQRLSAFLLITASVTPVHNTLFGPRGPCIDSVWRTPAADGTAHLAWLLFSRLVYLAFNPSRERARSPLLERETRSSTIDFCINGRGKQPTEPETRLCEWLQPLICYNSGNL